MSRQQDDPFFRTPTGDITVAEVETRPRRRWIPATAVIGGVLVTAALTGAGIASAADEGGTPTSSPSASASAPAVAGSADVTAPVPSSGAVPAPAADGTTPTPPSDGSAPASGAVPGPPAGGPAAGGAAAGGAAAGGAVPAPPAGGPGAAGRPAPGGPAADGSTRVLGVVTTIDDSSITVRTDAGDDVTATIGDTTTFRADPPAPGTDPSSVTATKPAVGQRVELRVRDGAVLEAGVVHAHADGTVLSTSGTSAVLVTRDGLHVTLDLSGADATVAVGDQVHADGSANADGTAIVVSSLRADG
jgi:hypothetical protein